MSSGIMIHQSYIPLLSWVTRTEIKISWSKNNSVSSTFLISLFNYKLVNVQKPKMIWLTFALLLVGKSEKATDKWNALDMKLQP